MEPWGKHVKASVQGSNLTLAIPIWLLLALAVAVWFRTEDRIVSMERRLLNIELILRHEFPKSTTAVERFLEQG